jgi:hypothetical protein
MLRAEIRIAQAPLEFCTDAALTIWFHPSRVARGTTTSGLVPLEH